MKFFIDTANLDEIAEAKSWGCLAGVTTNPSLYAKTGGELKDFEPHMLKIAELCEGLPRLGGVDRDDCRGHGQRRAVACPRSRRISWSSCPCARRGSPRAARLPTEDARQHDTRLLRHAGAFGRQRRRALHLAICGPLRRHRARRPVSARRRCRLHQELRLVRSDPDGRVESSPASIRTPNHVTQAALMGADIATVPMKALKKCLRHPLTDAGLASFAADWARVTSIKNIPNLRCSRNGCS